MTEQSSWTVLKQSFDMWILIAVWAVAKFADEILNANKD